MTLQMLGAETIGSKYTKSAKAGDGLVITDGVRVRFVKPAKRSMFSYDQPEPLNGSIGTIKGDFYEFNKSTWAEVAVDGQKTYSIRVQELRVLDPSSPTYTKVAAAALAASTCGVGPATTGYLLAFLFFLLVVASLSMRVLRRRSLQGRRSSRKVFVS